jgi:hypothetical protein
LVLAVLLVVEQPGAKASMGVQMPTLGSGSPARRQAEVSPQTPALGMPAPTKRSQESIAHIIPFPTGVRQWLMHAVTMPSGLQS